MTPPPLDPPLQCMLGWGHSVIPCELMVGASAGRANGHKVKFPY